MHKCLQTLALALTLTLTLTLALIPLPILPNLAMSGQAQSLSHPLDSPCPVRPPHQSKRSQACIAQSDTEPDPQTNEAKVESWLEGEPKTKGQADNVVRREVDEGASRV